jgi:hypothetical protein
MNKQNKSFGCFEQKITLTMVWVDKFATNCSAYYKEMITKMETLE